MNRPEREAAVRQIMERAVPHVPPELHADVVRRGSRMLRRRTLARRLLWLLLFAAVVAFAVWAVMVQPWVEPPSETTPPLTDW
jgi:ferric-dicitrate binding protein FerR (iron transport regulator)